MEIDWITIATAATMNTAIGSIWYSRRFFRSFLPETVPSALDSSNLKSCLGMDRTPLYFCSSLLLAFFFSFFFTCLEIVNVTDGMLLGFLFWLGFAATADLSLVIWRQHSWRVFFLHTGCRLLSFLVIGGIFGA